MNVDALNVVMAMIAATNIVGLGALVTLVLLDRRDQRRFERDLERIRRH